MFELALRREKLSSRAQTGNFQGKDETPICRAAMKLSPRHMMLHAGASSCTCMPAISRQFQQRPGYLAEITAGSAKCPSSFKTPPLPRQTRFGSRTTGWQLLYNRKTPSCCPICVPLTRPSLPPSGAIFASFTMVPRWLIKQAKRMDGAWHQTEIGRSSPSRSRMYSMCSSAGVLSDPYRLPLSWA